MEPKKALIDQDPCVWCGGTGFMRINAESIAVKLNSTEDTNRVVVCDCRRKRATA
jgi:hypothetical protein